MPRVSASRAPVSPRPSLPASPKQAAVRSEASRDDGFETHETRSYTAVSNIMKTKPAASTSKSAQEDVKAIMAGVK